MILYQNKIDKKYLIEYKTKTMRIKITYCVMLAFLVIACSQTPEKNEPNETQGLKYIFDMVHNNPGEERTVSKYTDPSFVKETGYNGMVPQWHIQCGLTYDSFEEGIIPEGSKERDWILKKQQWVKQKITEAESNDMPVYAFTDILVLPTIILEKYKNEIVKNHENASGFSAIHGKLVPDINQPLTQKLIITQIDELFSTFPELDGLFIRFGETYLFDTPFHSGGNPVHGDENSKIAGHVKLINILKEEICQKRGKKLFYRTWDFGFFHTNPEAFLKITDQVEPHENLVFSIKYPKGDFHRLHSFNPTLGLGKHPYIVEFQCQAEYYGKGAHPVYMFDGMLNGYEEFSQIMNPGEKQGIKDLLDDPKFEGLWTWSRGGGWQGPFISNELWCDINAFTAVEWAKNTSLSEGEALKNAALKIGILSKSIDDFVRLMHLSAKGVVRGHYSLIDVPQANFNVWWMRDHFMSGTKPLKPFFNYVVENNKIDEVLTEKLEAVAIWEEMEKLAAGIEMKSDEDQNYLRISTTYGRIKYEIVKEAFTIMLLGYEGDQNGVYEMKKITTAIVRYDQLWNDWEELKAKNKECATLYYPDAFSINSNGVSGNVEGGLGATVNKYREIVK